MKLESTEILEIIYFLLISCDLCHKQMLLESLTIPLTLSHFENGCDAITGLDIYALVPAASFLLVPVFSRELKTAREFQTYLS